MSAHSYIPLYRDVHIDLYFHLRALFDFDDVYDLTLFPSLYIFCHGLSISCLVGRISTLLHAAKREREHRFRRHSHASTKMYQALRPGGKCHLGVEKEEERAGEGFAFCCGERADARES